MKVFSAETMASVDRRAIEDFGIPGLRLMENAGRGCTEIIAAKFSSPGTAAVVCGRGNNGGDGYVIARLLGEKGWSVSVAVLARREDISGDALANLLRLDPGTVTFCGAGDASSWDERLSGADVVVDAIFGTGLRSEVTGIHAEFIAAINRCGKCVVAVDIPSGVSGSSGRILACAVRAELTVTFAALKLGHVLYPGAEAAGELRVVDIGIPGEVLHEAPGVEFMDAKAAAGLIRRRSRTAHKGSCGHCLIVAGSTGKTGAAAMAANSAVRAGAGLVTLAVPASLNRVLEVKTTEPMTVALPDDGRGFLPDSVLASVLEQADGKDAVAVGPGIGTDPSTVRLVRALPGKVAAPLVLDADGLNAVAGAPEILREASTPVVVTPHPGEMARLSGLGISGIEEDRIAAASSFAREYGAYVILKGARTVVASPGGEVAVNGSGNPGMASGGMGDVLTGVVAALLGQGYDPWSACRLAVFLHGLAADLAAAEKGEIGLTATDVQERLPYASKLLLEKGHIC